MWLICCSLHTFSSYKFYHTRVKSRLDKLATFDESTMLSPRANFVKKLAMMQIYSSRRDYGPDIHEAYTSKGENVFDVLFSMS